jgi:Domain of unknown function (DUF4188)
MVKIRRQTVDFIDHPDLVVVYLGMRAKTLRRLRTVASFGPKIQEAIQPRPDGLLFHQLLLFGLLPLHVGIRQYWRDFDALERWVRTEPHRTWWRDLLRGGSGTAFWHETYFMRGGMEAIFLDLDRPTGLLAFAPAAEARGAMFSARRRLRLAGEELAAPPLSEQELYG